MNTIHEIGEWPKDFTQVTMVALKKKTKATKWWWCGNEPKCVGLVKLGLLKCIKVGDLRLTQALLHLLLGPYRWNNWTTASVMQKKKHIKHAYFVMRPINTRTLNSVSPQVNLEQPVLVCQHYTVPLMGRATNLTAASWLQTALLCQSAVKWCVGCVRAPCVPCVSPSASWHGRGGTTLSERGPATEHERVNVQFKCQNVTPYSLVEVYLEKGM